MHTLRRISVRGGLATAFVLLLASCDAAPDDQLTVNQAELRRLPRTPARLVAPLSGAIVGDHRPVFRWDGPAFAVGEICRDRGCRRVISAFVGTAHSARSLTSLPAGPLFWRVLGSDGRWTDPWELFVAAGQGNAPRSVLGFRYDANADGFADAVVRELRPAPAAAPLFNRLHIYPGGVAGIDAGRETVIDEAGQPSVVGDVNGDGYGDLAVPLWGAAGLAIYPGGPGGVTGAPLSLTPGSFTPVLAVGDFNGDGYGDVVADRGASTIAIFLGSPTGLGATPAADHTFPGVFTTTSVLTTGDLNGDGFGDVVLIQFDSTAQSSQLGVMYGGPGSVLDGGQALFFPLANYAQRGTTADVNGDGVVDLVATLFGTASVFFGGVGGIAPAVSQTLTFFPRGDSVIHNLAAGDFNGDGSFDVAAAIGTYTPILFFEDDRIDVHLGSAAGLQSAVANSLAETDYFADNHNRFGANAVAAGDLDGDRRDDLLVGATTVFPPPLPDGFPLGPSSAFVFRGTPGGVSAAPALRLEGEPGFGTGVAISSPGISLPGL